MNQIRRENPALQSDHSLVFHETDNPNLICYSKQSEDLSNLIIVVVNLDWAHTQNGWVTLDPSRWVSSHGDRSKPRTC